MAARASSLFRLEILPAPARNTAAPVAPQPEPAGRARPPLPFALRGLWNSDLRLLGQLQELVGDRYNGHGWTEDGGWFVDVLDLEVSREGVRSDGLGLGVERFEGRTFKASVGAALRAARGER